MGLLRTSTSRNENLLDAATGDIVRVRTSKRRQGERQRVSGRILEVLERRTNRFVGTYQERNELGFVSVDGSPFESDIWVGDAGAKKRARR